SAPPIANATVLSAANPDINCGINPINSKIGPAATVTTATKAVKNPTTFCIVGESSLNQFTADFTPSITLINASPNFLPNSAAGFSSDWRNPLNSVSNGFNRE